VIPGRAGLVARPATTTAAVLHGLWSAVTRVILITLAQLGLGLAVPSRAR